MDKLKKYVENPKKYKIITLKYSDEEKKAIDKYNIISDDIYDYYGKTTKQKIKDIKTFFDKQGSNKDTLVLSKIVNKLCKNMAEIYNIDHVWVSIRITLPSSKYDILRWHQDGKFFTNSDRINSKFITTLKGPGTLIVTDATIEQINKLYPADSSMEYRNKIMKIFKKNKIKQTKNNQGLIFVTGTNDATVHSEPPFSEPRIFLSILPCTKEEIENLKTRWNKK